MLTIIFSWSVFFSIFFLIGKLCFNPKALKILEIDETPEWYEYFWLGFAIVLAILQIWSLFLPVNVYSLVFMIFLAGVSICLYIKRLKIPRINITFVLLTMIILFVISYFASLSGGWGDTLGYHISTVKWINLSKTVPGLANLYTRLGFNSSTFLYDALVGNLFLKDRASHVALSLLSAVLSIQILWILLKSKNIQLKAFSLLAIPIFIEGIIHSVQVSSFSHDFALLMLVFVISLELFEWNRKSMFISAILSLLLITVKLSGVAFSIVVILFVFHEIFWDEKKRFRKLILLPLVEGIILIPYIVRNIILSGWPFYPLPLFGLKLTWTMPKERVADLANVIRGWAISPGAGWHVAAGQSFNQWFPEWLTRNIGHVEIKLSIFTVFFVLIMIFSKRVNMVLIKKNLGIFIIFTASLASIFYLLFTAPDFRFGAVYFWIFFASVTSFFLAQIFKKKHTTLFLAVLISLYFIYKIAWPPRIDSEVMLRSLRWDQPGGIYEVLVTPEDGSPAFNVNMANEESFCGNTDLPCTSEVSNNFKEITPGNIFGGYAPVR